MKPELLKELADGVITAVKGYVVRKLEPTDKRIESLERALGAVHHLETRVAKLETRGQLSYRGIWKEGDRYSAGSRTGEVFGTCGRTAAPRAREPTMIGSSQSNAAAMGGTCADIPRHADTFGS